MSLDKGKIQKFQITDSGEFVDGVFREQHSSAIYGKMIGRNPVGRHEKTTFTAGDIAREGYLYKRGSWFKTWKKRYFVLRKDINELCYFSSKESRVLLGSLRLEKDSVLVHLRPTECGGCENVLSIAASPSDSEEKFMIIRSDNVEEMVRWAQDILKEMVRVKENGHSKVANVSWWQSKFSESSMIDITKIKRGSRSSSCLSRKEPQPLAKMSETLAPVLDEISEANDIHDSEPDSAAEVDNVLKLPAKASEESDDEEDEGAASPLNDEESAEDARGSSFPAEAALVLNRRSLRRQGNAKKRKQFKEKQEKPFGPPPFSSTNVDQFRIGDSLAGYQFNLNLRNLCCCPDMISVIVYLGKYMGPPVANNEPIDKNALKWQLHARSEVWTVTEKLVYGKTTVEEVHIHFMLMIPPFTDVGDVIKVEVYRHLTPDSQARIQSEKKKPGDSNFLISSCAFFRKTISSRRHFQVPMKVATHTTVDISNPIEEIASATLGAVLLSSPELAECQSWFSQRLASPYCEVLFSFPTVHGATLTLEQLFVSPLAIQVSSAFSSMLLEERSTIVESILKILEAEEEFLSNELTQSSLNTDGMFDIEANSLMTVQRHEEVLHVLNVMDETSTAHVEFLLEVCRHSKEMLDNSNGNEGAINSVIRTEVGGQALRRSVWKKNPQWQFCTVNLNVHLITSKEFLFESMQDPLCQSKEGSLHSFPTITLGCPAAHFLGYYGGGLRRMFQGLESDQSKLIWMQALQASYGVEELKALLKVRPEEACLLFGTNYSFGSSNEIAIVTAKRYELALRLDCCASQILGFALTVVKTVCLLAAKFGGSYSEVLARSLKIGFCCCLQSMLSTKGDELGMIEDLDMAALWLHLVTVRLMSTAHLQPSSDHNVRLCRDISSGRIVVDLPLSIEEESAVRKAQESMVGFQYYGFQPFAAEEIALDEVFHVFHRPVKFCGQPAISVTEDLTRVVAVAELFGVAFNQGVNEMQTLANMSSAKDVQRQVDINTYSFDRLKEYYGRYRVAVQFQMSRKEANYLGQMKPAKPVTPPPAQEGHPQVSSEKRISTEELYAAIQSHSMRRVAESDRMLQDAEDAIQLAAGAPADKHVHVLLHTSALCREMAGTVGILCKSGKDRTSMGVTLEDSKALVEELGATNGVVMCQTMRIHGVRRMNVYANIGHSAFAFNAIQRHALPVCYRPPANVCSGNVTS